MSRVDLLALTAELVAIPSVSGDEAALAERIEEELSPCGWLEVERIGDNVVARTRHGRSRRVIVAGHLDTVPPAGNDRPRSQGDDLWGVGAADMKGGLAVMVDLARSVTDPEVDVTWCFYAREEVSRHENGLEEIWAARPDLLAADAAVLAEPTDGRVEAGCQGTMRAVVRLTGQRAHTARPFVGVNAIHRMAPVLERVAAWEGRAVVLEGCEYVEQLQAVAIEGGVAGNVVPDAASLTVNYRYAPDRDEPAAREFLDALLADLVDADRGDRIDVVDQAPGALPALGHPLVAALVRASGVVPRAKAGWTDVSRFAGRGVPAANFGPGDPLLAHRADECVSRSSLDHVRAVLAGLLSDPNSGWAGIPVPA
ncbi:MAG: succinyl-diaminopimelate desuccinylase [Acidimicrobiales bacterium]